MKRPPLGKARADRAILRFAVVACLGWMGCVAAGGAPRALPDGKLPNDARLGPLKDLEGSFPFNPPSSKAVWERRAEQVRRQILVSQGLWPTPSRTPLNAVIHGRVDCGDYTVEKAYFESMPGFFVTGNLYRPKTVQGRLPAVLFAHGHWENARLSETADKELRVEIATGQERFESGGRSRFQSMCVQLARMGCVVWQWDMLGDSDSRQFSRELVHGFSTQRPEMNRAEGWGLFSPQAESRLQSVMGLQTWNSIRSLDFVLSLPEVDPDRVAFTGASGGGTQTLMAAGIDPRIRLSFPAVMVSTAMQGGCTCENACWLRVDTGNVEFAGLFAPKPLGMTCANDWTKEMASKGFPELQKLYALMGAPKEVMLSRGEQFPHNYNAVSRSAFYTWLNAHFGLGRPSPVIERDYEPLTREKLTVWDAEHPAPKPADPEFERGLLAWWDQDARARLEALRPGSRRWRDAVGPALDVMTGRRWDTAGPVEWRPAAGEDRGAWSVQPGLLRNPGRGEELPAVLCAPKKPGSRAVLWLCAGGKAGLFQGDGSLAPGVQRLVDAGVTVLGVDLLYQGEFLLDGRAPATTPKVGNPREAAAFTFGYNRCVAAHRANDILTAAAFLSARGGASAKLGLVAVDGMGPVAALARAQADGAFERSVLRAEAGFFGKIADLGSPDFLPGGARYGDVEGMLTFGSGEVKRVSTAAEADEAVAWLLQ